MKIVYLLASSMISGGGKVILQQADELARRGHAVTVVGPEEAPAWYSLRHARYERSPFASSERLRDADVAVATFWTTIEPAVASARGRVFHLCQGYEADFRPYAPVREKIVASYRLPTLKLVLTPHLRETLVREGHGDAHVIGQSFEAAAFSCAVRPAREPLSILLPGIDEGEIKGVREALEALARMRQRGASFRILRVSAEPVSRWEKDLAVTDEYHRAVAPARMPLLYQRADVFLGPSHREEGFDLPALEALASGLPAALSDTPAHRFSAGDSALFFPPADADAIASAVSRLLREPELRRRLSAEGPARAARFRTVDVGDRLEEAFRRAVDV